MSVDGLPARIAYAVVALVLAGTAGFYCCMHILPELTSSYPQLDPDLDGFAIFKIAIGIGMALAFTASLVALTLPWIRHRKHRGRGARIAFSGILVVLVSIVFADQGYGFISDLAIAAWMTYTLTFTFIRYGIVNQARRTSVTAEDY